MDNDAFLTIAHLAPLLRRRSLSPVELTDWVLSRIDHLQPRLNAFITVSADLARARARRAEKEINRGEYRGVLHGIPISLKDLLYTRGLRTTGGSRILQKFVPAHNAQVVDMLEMSGAILVGKTNLHEFAFGVTNVNPHYGPTRNPWNPDCISGGSSGGSAVSVSTGMAIASVGTDTGGSIRIPVSACGCVGLKPTFGLVPVAGVIPLSSSLDHVGPLCRCAQDAAHMLAVLASPDVAVGAFGRNYGNTLARSCRGSLKGFRVGIPKQYFFDDLQGDVRSSVLAAIHVLENQAVIVSEVEIGRLDQTPTLAANVTIAEALAFHWEWLRRRPKSYGADVRERLQSGKRITAVDYLLAQENRRRYVEEFDKAFQSVEALAVPVLPVVAPPIGDAEVQIGRHREDTRHALLRLARPANLTGMPAISVPCGFSSQGMPIGIQFIARKYGETSLLKLAFGYEQATEWHRQFPCTHENPETG